MRRTRTKFTKQLPRPPRINLTGLISTAAINMEQFSQQVLTGYPKTKLYGYGNLLGRPSWPGPTIVAMKNRTTRVLWRNNLPPGRGSVADSHLLKVDKSLEMALPSRALPAGNIPTVPASARLARRARERRAPGGVVHAELDAARRQLGQAPLRVREHPARRARSGTTTTRSASRG